MKKVILVAALVGVCAAAQAKTFAYGVKAGLEMPSINADNPAGSAKSSTGFHAGLFAQVNVPVLGVGVQPEVLYARRGVPVFGSTEAKGVSYIDVPVNITWGIDVKLVRPFLAVTPYLSYRLDDLNWEPKVTAPTEPTKVENLDYGVGFGAGIELLQRLQLMGRYNVGVKNLVSDGSYKMRGFSLSLGVIL